MAVERLVAAHEVHRKVMEVILALLVIALLQLEIKAVKSRVLLSKCSVMMKVLQASYASMKVHLLDIIDPSVDQSLVEAPSVQEAVAEVRAVFATSLLKVFKIGSEEIQEYSKSLKLRRISLMQRQSLIILKIYQSNVLVKVWTQTMI